jgi:hypothetical protein
MATASHVQVSPDSTGKDIDAQQLTSTESGTPTVLRQTITIGDPTTYGNLATIEGDAVANRIIVRDQVQQEELLKVLYAINRNLSAIRDGIGRLIGQPLFADDMQGPGDSAEFTH